MINNLVAQGRLPIGTKVLFEWNGELVTGKVRMSHRYWHGSLLVEVPEDVVTHYPRFCGKRAVDIQRKSVRVLASR